MNRMGRILPALSLVAGTLGLLLWLARPPAALAVYLDAEPAVDWAGLTDGHRAGVITLLQEALELDPRFTVLQEQPLEHSGRTWRSWKLSARRQGDQMRLLLRDDKGTLTEACGPPAAAIRSVFGALGFETAELPRLLPEEPAAFWELASLSGPFTFEQLKLRQIQSLGLAERNPASSAAWYRAAYMSYRLLVVEASTQPDAHAVCERLFQRTLAGLPGYPRALYQYCRYKADTGAGREAIELGMQLRDRFPNHPLAYGALAYAARNAGLLEGAARALAAREALVGGLQADPGLGENTYLYSGDLARFEQSLVSRADAAPNPLRLFYQAYAKLLRGDRTGALPLFRQAQAQPGRIIQFEALAQVYEYALTDRSGEALDLLRRLRDSRTQIRVPDGEFTFKLAEAFAFLGAPAEAMETATSAFSQGFGCTRWYRKAPFLQGLQPLPRWQAQVKHIQEREALLAERFPAKDFGRK
jgi:hypothetical protein